MFNLSDYIRVGRTVCSWNWVMGCGYLQSWSVLKKTPTVYTKRSQKNAITKILKKENELGKFSTSAHLPFLLSAEKLTENSHRHHTYHDTRFSKFIHMYDKNSFVLNKKYVSFPIHKDVHL